MAKTVEEKEKFIQLRAKGLSFDKIAKELNVSKNTLLKWNGEFYEQVEEAQFHELDSLLDEFKVSRRTRFEQNCKILNAVYKELNKRMESNNLVKLSVPELLKLAEALEKNIEQETEKSTIFVEVPDTFDWKKKKRVEL